MNNFQTILVAVFLAFAVFAVLIFSGLIKIGSSTSTSGLQGKIVVWGTFSSSDVKNSLDSIESVNKNLSLSYVGKDPATYSQDLIEAFANGNGPDLFIISPEMIKKNASFIYKIPYVSYPEKTFTDS
jgi:ABC-type glycerol-3-phosphate transport system substrate-binding protein